MVRPNSEAAFNSLLDVVTDGVHRPLFPLCWKKDNFGFDPKDFSRTAPSLKEEEADACQKILAFDQSFCGRLKLTNGETH